MNLGKSRNQPKYICDKCGNEISGYHKNSKQYNTPNKYYKADKSGYPKKDFDLCENCEMKFREWLNTKEIPTPKGMINRFPVYKER
jgi:protein-arginine kinase activator protein McsA